MTMKWKNCSLAAALLALALVPALASAQPKTADEWYKEGETQYNLGNFDTAIEAFKKGFALETVESRKAAYLFNIAQAYRFAKDCSNAQFFYKRFLGLHNTSKTMTPLDPRLRATIEARIKELEECARQQEAVKNKPPENLDPDDPAGGQGDGTDAGSAKGTKGKDVADRTDPDDDTDEDPDDQVGVQKTLEGAPRVLSLRLVGGIAKIFAGDLDTEIKPTGALIGGFPIVRDKLILEIGGGFSFTAVPFVGSMSVNRTAQLIGLVANAGATYLVHPKVGLRADAGLGVQWFNGVSESPFTDFAPASGPLPMFHVRAGVSVEYAITPNILATLVPFVFSYSPPAAGLRQDISSISAIDFMVGLGYRM